jgi:hypothetical protein
MGFSGGKSFCGKENTTNCCEMQGQRKIFMEKK